jgi:hypothetical protein
MPVKPIAAALLALAFTVPPAAVRAPARHHVIRVAMCFSHPVGATKCLRTGQFCVAVDNPQYERHGFVCVKAGRTHRLAVIVAARASDS